MSSLQGQPVQTTYEGLIKSIDNLPIPNNNIVQLSDGAGNPLPLIIAAVDPNTPGSGYTEFVGAAVFDNASVVTGIQKGSLGGQSGGLQTTLVIEPLPNALVGVSGGTFQSYGNPSNRQISISGQFYIQPNVTPCNLELWLTLSNDAFPTGNDPFAYNVIGGTGSASAGDQPITLVSNQLLSFNKTLGWADFSGTNFVVDSPYTMSDTASPTGYSAVSTAPFTLDLSQDIYLHLWYTSSEHTTATLRSTITLGLVG